MNKSKIFEAWEAKLNEDVSATVFITGLVSIEIPEEPEGMRGWTNHKGGSEVDWSDFWESEIIHDIRTSDVIIQTPSGEFQTVDCEFMGASLSSSGQYACYDTIIQTWVVAPNVDVFQGTVIAIIDSERLGRLTASISRLKIEDTDF